MYAVVASALEVYYLVMRSLNEIPKRCEAVLECIVLLACSGYISGESGMKDTPREV
jgi:hypothetical protein